MTEDAISIGGVDLTDPDSCNLARNPLRERKIGTGGI